MEARVIAAKLADKQNPGPFTVDYQVEEMQREIAAAQQQMDEGLRRGLGQKALDAIEEHIQDLELRLQDILKRGELSPDEVPF
jgi:bacterioferritin (cytochrome b1)